MTHHRALIALAALALTAGCREPSECPSGWCGTAVILYPLNPDVLNPPLTQVDIGIAITDLLFLKLADVGMSLNTRGDSGFVPLLARRWSWDDSVTLRFDLDPRARWHDGPPVTAADVSFTFEVYRDTLVNSPVRPLLDRITSVAAPDSHTVVFHFQRPYPEAFFDAVYQMRILPRHLLDTIPRGRLASHAFGRQPVGDGPYKFVRWVPGEVVELEADSTFYLGRPGIRRLLFKTTPNAATMVTQLIADEGDILNFIGPPENVERVRAAPQQRVVEYPPNSYSYIGFNLRDPRHPARPHPLFGNRDLRRALVMAVDRQAAVRAVLGDYAQVALGPLSSMLPIWSDSLPQIPFDTAEAARTLDRLGWGTRDRDGTRLRDGKRLEFDLLVPSTSQLRHRMAVVVQEQFKRAGIAMRIPEMDLNTVIARANAGQFDAMFGSWQQDASPSSLQQTWGSAGIGGFNWGAYSSPAFDRLVQQAVEERDGARATRFWHEAIAQINGDAPAIWLYSAIGYAAVHRRIGNVTIRPDEWAATLWTWRINPDSLIPRDRVGTP